MESSCRSRRQGDHAIRQHVLGRTLRPTTRPIRSPLVSITASQHDKERERQEAETSHGNVRSEPTFRSDRRTANRTTVTSARASSSEAGASLKPPFSLQPIRVKRMANVMKLDRLDHLVLTVRDIEKTCKFYSNVLGMEVITFNNARKHLTLIPQKINNHP